MRLTALDRVSTYSGRPVPGRAAREPIAGSTEAQYHSGEEATDTWDELLSVLRRSLLARAGWPLDSDAADDCMREVVLLLWHLRERIAKIPAPQRQAFVMACARRELMRQVRRERAYCDRRVLLDEASPPPGPLSRHPQDELSGETILDVVEEPSIALALQSLCDRDYELLDAHYFHGERDAEIAGRLGLSPAAVKMRRNRIIARLREMMGGAQD
jgi:RNA polymerase sigma factor (sigma-70 family)